MQATAMRVAGVPCSRLQASRPAAAPARAPVGLARPGLHQGLRRRVATAAVGRNSSQANAVVVEAPAAPERINVAELTAEQRKELALKFGYKQIGAELPDDVTLTDVIKSMPQEVFQLNEWRAWGAVATSILSMAGCLFLINAAPWYLLPFAWALAGTAFTGFFVVGHDCGHRSFSKNKLLEDIVGTLMFAPLIYPFEPWRIKHNHHHKHTNKLIEDTAWHPVMPEHIDWWSPTQAWLYKTFLGSPLKLWASVGHWLIWHFDLNKFTEQQKPRVLVSWAACAAFVAIGWPLLIANFGLVGWFKLWLMPWLGYHFWMSTFTLIHHTAPHIPFKPQEEWNAAKAQLQGTVHCDFPAWVEFLTHDISVHVPHHVSSAIPWYNLRKATDSLRANWGQYMTETDFNWRMLKTAFTELHVYDEAKNYTPFDSFQEEQSPLLALQRRWLPNWPSKAVLAGAQGVQQ